MSEAAWGITQSIFTILGGLGLFLYGMNLMSEGLENMAGDRMRVILEKATSNRFLAILVGTVVTVIIQSSSATTVMAVGFVNASLMTLTQAIGVIMGANIGTTVTAQIISLKIDYIAPLFIFIGLVMTMIFKKRAPKNAGTILLGFGVLFFGITVMGEPLKDFSAMPGFQAILTSQTNPFLSLLAGLVFTAIIQSSSAATGIIVALYLGGVNLPFETAAFLTLGSNIGTCVTAMLASLNSNRESKRAALTHVLFNVIGCTVFGITLVIFPGILTWIQETWTDGARQIAMFHTIFNVSTVLLLVGFVNQLAKLVRKLVPELPYENDNAKRLIYLDQNIMQTPAIAVTQAERELARMGRMAADNLKLALDSFYTLDHAKAEKVLETEQIVNYLNHQITAWLVRIRGLSLSAPDIQRLGKMLHTVSDMERISDHAENIAEYTLIEESGAKISPKAMEELKTLSALTQEICDLAIGIFETRDAARLHLVQPIEDQVDDLCRIYVENHITRLNNEVCDPRGGVVFTDMLSDLERVADHCVNIANSILGETEWDKVRHELKIH